MWESGSRVVGGVVFFYEFKYFYESSDLGINGGRISKLCIRSGNGDEVIYDRGWVIFPKNEEAMDIFLDLVMRFN